VVDVAAPPSKDGAKQGSVPVPHEEAQLLEQRIKVGLSPLMRAVQPDLRETFHNLVNRLQLDNETGLASRVAIVAAEHGDGVTVVATSLAMVMANDLDARVCLMTVGRPARRRADDGAMSPGLYDVIADGVPVEDVLQPTIDARLQLLEVGSRDPAVIGQIARSQRMVGVFDELDKLFDYVVLDLPPILGGTEGLAMARHAYSYILVVKHGITPMSHVRHAATELKSLTCLGVIINRFSSRIPKRLRRFFAT
jgi:Mrp family chromosome partitioning ATPase